MDYESFIASKAVKDCPVGISDPPPLAGHLFAFQRDIVRWALMRGRAAIFADCGMGKTAMQLEWAKAVASHTGGKVLILAPLAVSGQTIREGNRWGVEVKRADGQESVNDSCAIWISNYERLENFTPELWSGIVLDESSILKSYSGKYRTLLVSQWGESSGPHFRLCATATPAPNDYMELGSHCEFLGVMTGSEMLAAYFINDPSNVGKYRIKGHGESPFWRWMATWAVMIRKPSDLGYSDDGYCLPPLTFSETIVDNNKPAPGELFAMPAVTMTERRHARANTVEERASVVVEAVNASDDCWLVWCDRNDESEYLSRAIRGAVEVRGSDKPADKESRLMGFAEGKFRVLVSKPSIAGWGMNYQHCHKMAFTGLSDSYEQFYQAIRRSWRFGQKSPVEVLIVCDRTEGAVLQNIRRKEADAMRMAENMAKEMSYISQGAIRADQKFRKTYQPAKKMELPSWM